MTHCKQCVTPLNCGTSRPCDTQSIAELEAEVERLKTRAEDAEAKNLGMVAKLLALEGLPRYRITADVVIRADELEAALKGERL